MRYVLSFLTIVFVLFSFVLDDTFAARNAIFNNTTNEIPYCDDNGECGLKEGIDSIKNIETIETDQKASEWIQNLVNFLLGFLALIATILIIYSGFNLLMGLGDEDKVKKSKQIILYSVLGLIVIFLAWPITKFVIQALNTASIN